MHPYRLLLSFAAVFPVAAHAETLLPDVAPVAQGQHVVINIPQTRLFVYENGTLKAIYPIAVGKSLTQTPLGEYKIGVKAFNPTWHIPKSIQAERARQGLPPIQSVPPGPNNPLGPVFVRFGDPKLGLGIHGTNAPASVPGVRSHGCVRMRSENALKFAKTINTGSRVSVIYQTVSLNADADNNLWLAAYGDPYKQKNLKLANLNSAMEEWATAHQLSINPKKVKAVLQQKKGTAVCITCSGNPKAARGQLSSLQWLKGRAQIVTVQKASEPAQGPQTNPALIEPEVEPLPQETGVPVPPAAPVRAQEINPVNTSPAPQGSFVPANTPAGSEPMELLF